MNSDVRFLKAQAVRLRELLDQADNDPILSPQLERRLEEVEEALKVATTNEGLFPEEEVQPPRIALFFRGKGVKGSEGIRSNLAGEMLIQYEKMFVEQALHDERLAARGAGRTRRRRGSEPPRLFFTGTPRGSFGLEFVPQQSEEMSQRSVHAQALKEIADAIVRISEDDNSRDSLEEIPASVLRPMTRFFKVLSQNEVELRLAFSDATSRKISASRIKETTERLERELKTEDLEIPGVFRGLTRETTLFDFLPDDRQLIDGTMSDSLTEEDFDRISELTNKRCIAKLQKTTYRKIDGSERVKYLLLDVLPESNESDRSIDGLS